MASDELLTALGADLNVTQRDAEGYFNIQTLQRSLNNLKPVTNESAKILVYQSRIALDKAMAIASLVAISNFHKPGELSEIVIKNISRDVKDIGDHLKWHQDHIGSDPLDIYQAGEDLKKYVILAFRTYNAAQQGQSTAETMSFYKEVISTIVDYMQKGKKALSKTSHYLAWTLGIAGVAAVGYGWYNLKMAKLKYLRQHND